MQTLAFDGRMGAAGDMLLGALVAAGADPAALDPVEAELPVQYEVGEVVKNGITSTRVRVVHEEAAERDADENGHTHDHEGGHGHSHDNGQDHEHSHDNGQDHEHSHDQGEGHDHSHDHDAEGHGHSRTYGEVVDLVEGMDIPDDVRADALAIFEILGKAEASVHGADLTETQFHEVGADDAVADVVGVCLLLADLDVDRVVTTPLATGGGTVTFSHGVYPVPTPAVVEIAEDADWSLRGGPVDTELLTPTGAAILAHVAEGVETLPSLRIESSGYGAGALAFPEHPNVLRAIVGEGEGRLVRDEITVLETNVDDVTPEVLGGLQETLQEAGARDVSILPATMKKSRPGHLVKVICKPEDVQAVARALAEETGTLGVREHGAGHRWIAERAFESASVEVDGETHEVTVKVASDADGTVYDVSAEYDEAATVAAETGLPVREVIRRAEDAVSTR